MSKPQGNQSKGKPLATPIRSSSDVGVKTDMHESTKITTNERKFMNLNEEISKYRNIISNGGGGEKKPYSAKTNIKESYDEDTGEFIVTLPSSKTPGRKLYVSKPEIKSAFNNYSDEYEITTDYGKAYKFTSKEEATIALKKIKSMLVNNWQRTAGLQIEPIFESKKSKPGPFSKKGKDFRGIDKKTGKKDNGPESKKSKLK